MKKNVLLPIFLLLQFYTLAQINNGDSLRQDLEKYTHNDTVRVFKMARYAYSLAQTNPYQSVEWYKNSIALVSCQRSYDG
jgi:hypothetical protein